MLTQLSIRNIVLIESCDITLGSGLCVLSGETGAGKSILLDSLGLVLGARGEASLVRRGEQQGMVTAEFDISDNAQAAQMLEEMGLAAEESLIIRRTVGSDGKTRCHINDQSVTVAALKKLGEALVEVHGQHDQRSLMDASLHRDMLDDYASQASQRKQVAAAYAEWKKHVDALTALRVQIEQAAREQDYLRHMHNELAQLAPEIGEEDALTTQRATMMQSEKLFELLGQAIAELNAGKGVASALRSAQRILARSPLAGTEALSVVIESLERAATDAEEAAYALEKIGEDSKFDAGKLERIEERLFALKAAGRKYNMPVEELAKLREDVAGKLSLMDSQEHKVAELTKAADAAKKIFAEAAQKLSAARKKSAEKLQKAVEAELAPLKMENTRFHVRVQQQDESAWTENGMDSVHFECATNVSKGAKDVVYAPLSKIASGGELSRFMLALKVSLSSVRQATTLIFDEIDTGTGGAVADAIGQRLGRLGKAAQVLVVTHLPQVAACGNQHLLVAKYEKGKKIITEVKQLSNAERKEELARMLAGATITPEARKAAQKLLEAVA